MAITGNFKGTSNASFRTGKSGVVTNSDGSITEINHESFLTTPAVPANSEGNTYFDATHKTLAIQSDDALHLTRVGQDVQSVVYNATGSTLTRGQAVYISGSNGTHPLVTLATATSAVSSKVVGLVASDIPDATVGHIILFGRMASIDTSAFGQGDQLYIDATTPGALTNTKPAVPIRIGTVTTQNVSGDIAVTAIGSGAGGSDLNDTSIKTANYSAAVSDLVLCNSTGGVFNVELPTAPNDGDVIGVFDVYGTFDSNAVTVTRANVLHKIQGVVDDLTLDFAGTYLEFKFVAATSDWRIQDTLAIPENTGLMPTTTKVAPYTAADKEMVAVDTSGGAVTITLPATPVNGSRVAVFDTAGFAGTNAITIDRNGNPINGVNTDDVIGAAKGYTEYVFDALAGTPTWVRVDSYTGSRFPYTEFRVYDPASPATNFIEWNLSTNTYSTTIYPPRSNSTYKMGDVPAFSATLNYTTGDQVIYQNRHYIASGNRAAAAWDGSVFVEVGSYVAVKEYDNNPQTGSFTPTANTFYKINTNGAPVTANLPLSPANKDRVGFLDYRSTWDTNAFTIARTNVAHSIDGVAANWVVNETGYVELEFDATNSNWMFVSRPGNTLTKTEYERVTGVATDFFPIPDGTTAQRGAPANPAIRYNTTLNAFEGWNGTAWGTIGGGGAEITVTQAAHGFVVGQALQMDGAVWALALADAPTTLGVGLVSTVVDVNTFKLSFGGEVTGLVGLTAGDYYYVSDTVAGGLTATEPTTYSNPIMLATSATTGVVLPYRPSAAEETQVVKSILQGKLTTAQTTNVAVNDHIKFDTLVTQLGTDISLDTASAYTNGGGASVGRITLEANRTYKLTAGVRIDMSGAGSYVEYRWYNVTGLQYAGISGSALTHDGYTSTAQTTAEAIVTPTVDSIYEVRVVTVAGTVDSFDSVAGHTYFTAEVIANYVPQTTDRHGAIVSRAVAGDQAIIANSATKILNWSIESDPNSLWDVGNQRFIIGRNGRYNIRLGVVFDTGAGAKRFFTLIYKNGGMFRSSTRTYTINDGGSELNWTGDLITGDTIEAYFWSDADCNLKNDAYTYGNRFEINEV